MEYEERSPLWGIGATAAAAGGLGTSIFRARHQLLDAVRVANRDVAAETANIASQLDRFNLKKSQPSISDIDQYRSGVLSLSANKSKLRQNIAQAAYESILSGRRVSHAEAYSAFKEISAQNDVLSAYDVAGKKIKSMSGNVGIMSSRMRDISAGGFERAASAYDVLSPGGFASTRKMAKISTLPKDVSATMENIIGRLKAAAPEQAKLNFSGVYNITDEFAGQTITTPILKANIAGKGVNIPLAETGLVYTGENLTARYVTRKAYGELGESLNYIDRYTSMLEEVLSKKQSQSQLNRSVHMINNNLIGLLNERDSAARAQAIWTMPEQVLPAGGRARARLTGLQSVSLESGRFMEDEVSKLMQQGLYPVGSPGPVAKGTYYTTDIAEDLYGPLGRWFPIEKRPEQFVRSQFGVTAAAKARATGFAGTFGKGYSRLNRKIQGKGYAPLMYGGADITSAAAYSAPQLTTFYAKSGDLGFSSKKLSEMMFAEEALLSKDITDMMEYETVVQNKISLKEGFRTNKEIIEALKSAEIGQVQTLSSPIGGGKFLGIEESTGRELFSEFAEGRRTDVIAAELTGADTATLYTRQRYKLGKGDYWKFFSEEAKYLGRTAGEGEFGRVLKAAGATDVAQATGQSLEAIYSSKLLEKNTMARVTQQMEAMAMFAGSRADRNLLPNDSRVLAEKMIGNPMQITGAGRLLNRGTVDAEYLLERNMIKMAKKFDFSKREMQMTFGLMGEKSLQRMVAEGVLREAEMGDILKSTGVVGLSKMRLGDLATSGVGGLASLEQSGFRLLAMKGEEGQRMAAELALRLRDKGELAPAERLLYSTVNESDKLEGIMRAAGLGGGTVDERTLSQIARSELISEQGRYIDIGKRVKALGGSHQLYIPGTLEAPDLMLGTISPKGQPIESPLQKEIFSLQAAIKEGDEEAIEAAGKSLRGVAHQLYEAQGGTRGKVFGSRFLTGIRQKVGESRDAFGISEATGKSMFDELIDRATTDKQRRFLEKQKNDFLSGQVMSGGVWRHPTTGPESFQFARYQLDKSLKGPLISAPAKFGQITIGGKTTDVDLSQMVGMKGDFDKDMYALSVISDETTSNKVRRKLSTSIESDYTKYLFNHYALQETIGKGNIGETISKMNREQAFAIGARKLTEANVATPQVNAALQKLKIGLQYSQPDKYRPLAELFWHLEEAAIGGKHGVMQGSLYQNIAFAVEQKDVKTMENVLTGLLGEQKTITGQLKAGDIYTPARQYTLDLEPRKWAETAIQSAADVSEEVDLAFKAAQVGKGKYTALDPDEIINMVNRRKAGSLDVAQSLLSSTDSAIDSFSEKANRTIRKAGVKANAISRALWKNKSAGLVGLGAATSIALMAPSISGVLPQTTEGPNQGRNIVPDDIGPPSGPGINPPSARIMSSPKVYDMSGMNTSSRANIRMSLRDVNNYSNTFSRDVRSLGADGNVNIRTVDDRSVLDHYSLANKIYERL